MLRLDQKEAILPATQFVLRRIPISFLMLLLLWSPLGGYTEQCMQEYVFLFCRISHVVLVVCSALVFVLIVWPLAVLGWLFVVWCVSPGAVWCCLRSLLFFVCFRFSLLWFSRFCFPPSGPVGLVLLSISVG